MTTTHTPVTRATFDQFMAPNYAPGAMIPVRGLGSRVWDQSGRELVDLAGGIAVSSVGHCHPKVVGALVEQANKIWHVANVLTNEPALKLARALVDATFADRIFLANSGGEANEAAFKLARRYATDHFPKDPKNIDKHESDKNEIVACTNSFHGRTLFTVTVGGQPKYTQGFGPLPAGIHHVPYNDLDAMKKVVNDKTCAIVVEPIQGEGGVTPAKPEYLQGLRALADQHGALLIFDEVQSGAGRTGELYAYMNYGVTPDILTTAKGIGGGFPIGAMLTTEKVAKSLVVGSHGSTYGGNPLGCAVALAVFDLITAESTRANVKARSAQLKEGLKKIGDRHQVFADVRGDGLLIGAELAQPFAGKAKDLINAAEKESVMVLMAGPDVMRFAPSLLITEADVAEGLSRFERGVAAFVAANTQAKAA
ncbi:MAG: aspartate aminotransferase family protein [Betaproteobacteria bacterium]|nr:aspartate aminotransferase family protein [Betaproteobacteria bacterium]